jgi:hypothetical protein
VSSSLRHTIRASCHCGAVVIEADSPPRSVTSCNCSICRRYAALWAHYTSADARIVKGQDRIAAYLWGDRVIEFYHCRDCGCCTHYESVEKNDGSRFRINARCFAPEDLAPLTVRHFDGADTWKFLD